MTTSRTPDNFAEAARAAYDRLTASPLDDVDDNALQRYLPALQARMNNPHATFAQLAATMDPPLSLSGFRERLYRAIEVAGVPVAPSGRSSRHRPSHFADNARAAYDRLTRHRPATMTDKIHIGYLAALQTQMDNPHASAAQLGAAMDPPMNAKAFGSLLLRATRASQRAIVQPTTNPVPAPQPAVNTPTSRYTYRSPSQFADAACWPSLKMTMSASSVLMTMH